MNVDGGAKGELKIKGQAEIQKRKSKWEGEGAQNVRILLVLTLIANAYDNLSRATRSPIWRREKAN